MRWLGSDQGKKVAVVLQVAIGLLLQWMTSHPDAAGAVWLAEHGADPARVSTMALAIFGSSFLTYRTLVASPGVTTNRFSYAGIAAALVMPWVVDPETASLLVGAAYAGSVGGAANAAAKDAALARETGQV